MKKKGKHVHLSRWKRKEKSSQHGPGRESGRREDMFPWATGEGGVKSTRGWGRTFMGGGQGKKGGVILKARAPGELATGVLAIFLKGPVREGQKQEEKKKKRVTGRIGH